MLKQQIIALKAELDDVFVNHEATNLNERINKLNSEKNALALFNVKRKKEIKEQIDDATEKLKKATACKNAIIEEIQGKIKILVIKQNDIETILKLAGRLKS